MFGLASVHDHPQRLAGKAQHTASMSNKGMAMERFMFLLAFILATVAADVRGEEHDGATPQSAQQAESGLKSQRPLILQEGDGEHLVRRAGPTGGWPYSIKLDGQNGNTEDFLVMAETRDTWISATNTGKRDIHVTAVFSRHGFERYMRAISVKQGEPLTPIDAKELPQLREQGHAMYWDT